MSCRERGGDVDAGRLETTIGIEVPRTGDRARPACDVAGISPAVVETADEVVETAYEPPEPSTEPSKPSHLEAADA